MAVGDIFRKEFWELGRQVSRGGRRTSIAIRDFLRGYGAFSGAGVSFWRGGEIFLRGLLSLREEKPDERRGKQGTGEWERH